MTIRRTSRSKFDMSIQFFHFEFFFFSSLLSFFGSIPGGLWQISLRNPFDGSLCEITLLDKWHLANPSWTGRLNNVPETGRLRKLMRRINRIFGNKLCILIGQLVLLKVKFYFEFILISKACPKNWKHQRLLLTYKIISRNFYRMYGIPNPPPKVEIKPKPILATSIIFWSKIPTF